VSDLATALDQSIAFLKRYVVFANEEQVHAAALWVAHTWTYDAFDVAPYLAIQSPEKRSGKTRFEECLSLLVREPLRSAGASLAALFRVIQEKHPTLLLDEVDTIFNKRRDPGSEDIRGLLNNGYRRGVPFLRVVGEGKRMHVEAFDVFCPKAIACIGRLPDTVQDRSIVIALKRRARSETVERFRFRTAELDALRIREWWESLADVSLPDRADVPEQIDDRAQDSWEPLLAIADAAGGEWPERARRAALVLSGAVEVEEEHIGILLLSDVRDIFAARNVERVAMKSLLEELHSGAYEEHPWSDWHTGRAIQATSIGRLLRPFGIRARQLWIGGANLRGYERQQFTDAFDRYLPLPVDSDSNRYTARSERASEHEASGSAVQTPSAEKKTNGGERSVPAPWDGFFRHTCSLCGEPIDPDSGFLDVPTMAFTHKACRPQMAATS
jgi:hypothetical protein